MITMRFVAHFVFTAVCAVVVLAAVACKKDEPAAPVKPEGVHTPPASAPPAAGSDADNKRIEALDLAVKIDAQLATLERGEKALPDGRKVEAWIARGTRPLPKKIVVATAADDKSVPASVVDMYYDDKGMLAFARAPDGLFVFKMESLALWLDADQKVKRGLNPATVKPRVDALLKDSATALTVFGLR